MNAEEVNQVHIIHNRNPGNPNFDAGDPDLEMEASGKTREDEREYEMGSTGIGRDFSGLGSALGGNERHLIPHRFHCC